MELLDGLFKVAPLPISLATVLFVTVAIAKHEKGCTNMIFLSKCLEELRQDIRDIRNHLLGVKSDE
jgi:hypothetical protein